MKRRQLLAWVLVSALTPAAAGAAPITALYVFGDSLSDQGNAFTVTGGFPPAPYAQRASNGPVAVEALASRLGVPLSAMQSGGTNYAYVGALTGPTVIPGTSPAISTDNFSAVTYGQAALEGTGMLNQVASFIGQGPSFNPDESLFVVWGGPNDFFIDPSAGTAASAVANLATAIQFLYGTGARRFLVPNMPDLSLTPSGLLLPAVQRAGLQALSIGFNSGLGLALSNLSLLPGIRITPFDAFGLLTAISANPGAFGFANAQAGCASGDLASGGTVCSDPESYVFWDSVHPTAAAHAMLGNEFADAVVPEPATITLLGIGLAVGIRQLRAARR